jgi:uncharacterized peroxidase-related enzyme
MADVVRPAAWVATVAPEDAGGVLKDAYDWQSVRLGAPTEFTQLGSLHPELVLQRLRFYKTVEEVPSGLTAIERDLVAWLTSRLNDTPHCASGLYVKLRAAGVSDELLATILADPRRPSSGDARLDAILAYTAVLTCTPGLVREADIDGLRAAGLDDADIVALNNLSAYYSYINRVATGLGLRSEIPAEHAFGAAPR